MRHYFLGLGSNQHPRDNMRRMLGALRGLAPELEIGRIVETAPVKVTGGRFLNVPVGFRCGLAAEELKTRLNAIEVALGRDRDDPEKKTKSRPADLDILLCLDGEADAEAVVLPEEWYIRPMLLELLAHLGLRTGGEPAELPAGVPLEFEGITIGERPLVVGGPAASGARLP